MYKKKDVSDFAILIVWKTGEKCLKYYVYDVLYKHNIDKTNIRSCYQKNHIEYIASSRTCVINVIQIYKYVIYIYINVIIFIHIFSTN